jgi:hypothetical protein
VHSYGDPEHPLQRPITAQLIAIALALLSVFIAGLLPQLLPPRLADPSWQLRLCGLMAETGVLPLMALGLVFLAAYLDPANLWVLAVRDRSSRLAGLAAVGFLLLIPLQIFALVSSSSSLSSQQQQQRLSAQVRLDALEQAIAVAASSDQLNQRLQTLQAPPLPAAELALPLPQLRRLLNQRLLQTRSLLQQQFARPVRLSLDSLLLQALRGILSNLAYGLAFAACSFGRRQQRSLLQSWLFGLSEFFWWVRQVLAGRKNSQDIL